MVQSKHISLRKGIDKRFLEINARIYGLIAHHRLFAPIYYEMLLATLLGKTTWPKPRLLDLGAGNGEFIRQFLRAHPTSKGVYVDAMPDLLQEAKRRLSRFRKRVRFVERALDRPYWAKGLGKFDVITANNLFHFIDSEDLPQLIQGCWHLLNSGGMFLSTFCVNIPEGLKDMYGAGREYFEGKDTMSEKDKEKLVALQEKRKRITGYEGLAQRSHTISNVYHDLDGVIDMMRKAGFESVDCCWKLYGFATCIGMKK